MAPISNEVLHDFPPMIKVYKDGRVERLWTHDFVPASVDPQTGVRSKDVDIVPEINLFARLFLPENANSDKKLPLLVFFHGGGFVAESAFSSRYHKYLNLLVAEANVVAVSLNYRLAPEHPLPTAYEDCWQALKWVASQSTEDDWIKDYADLNRVYIGGDSPGGNYAYNVAMRIGTEKLDGINLCGVFLNCPFFAGKDAIGNEETHQVFPKSYVDKYWRFVCPDTTGCDDPRVNPAKHPNLSKFGCKRLLAHLAEKDVLCVRGWYFKEALSKSGWDGEFEVVEVKGEDHLFSLLAPESENAIAMRKKVAAFINF